MQNDDVSLVYNITKKNIFSLNFFTIFTNFLPHFKPITKPTMFSSIKIIENGSDIWC